MAIFALFASFAVPSFSATGTARARSIIVCCVLALVVTNCARVTPERRLSLMWSAYRANHMTDAGYAIDPLRSGHVTSEAQSYALLQSAWLGDRETFDRVLHWTKTHLQRPDGLFSWLWDPAADGRIVDANTATDGDIDIAFALIIAADAFREPAYRDEAARIVRAIRQHASLRVGDDWFPSAGNWAGPDRVVNLSYFAPYAFAYFDALDPGAGWLRAIDIGYQLLADTTRGRPARLPPDFMSVTADGAVTPLPDTSRLSEEFSFDAIRIAWRIEMDCRLRSERRACAAQPLIGRAKDILARDGRLVSRYSVGGHPQTSQESLSFYGALLPSFSRAHPDIAQAWRQGRLSDRSLTELGEAKNRYYDANWVWFGLALADGVAVARTPRP